MPADRHIPVAFHKNGPCIRLPPVDSPEDSTPKNTTMLPSFADLIASLDSLSPPSTPRARAFPPLQITTPPSSMHTPSSRATDFPVSPFSPTPYSEPPRSTLSQTSFFRDQGPTYHRGDTSPSKDYVPLGPGLSMAYSPEGHETDSRSPWPITTSGIRSSDLLECGWPDCAWAEYPRKNLSWSQHFKSHFESALPFEKKQDEKATCRWGGCKSRISGRCWSIHIRNHDKRFVITCPLCSYTYVTDQGFESHMREAHQLAMGGGASGSRGGQ